MGASDHFERKRPTKTQLELLSKITNPIQKKALIEAIESGEEIPFYAWTPIPDSITRDKIIEILMEVRKAGEEIRKMAEDWISPLEPIVEGQEDSEIVCGYVYESLIFIPKSRALKFAEIHRALQYSRTWGEFKSSVPQRVYDSIMQSFQFDDEPMPEDPEPFCAEEVPGYTDGDFPGWPQQEMLTWVPKAIQEKYGSIGHSFVSGPCLDFNPKMEPAIISALEKMGYTCIKDEILVRGASGFDVEENDSSE